MADIIGDDTGWDNVQKHMDAQSIVPEMIATLKLAVEYFNHRQRRYKNRHPVWVERARAILASLEKP
jgi:hypothetical protein